MWAKNVTEPPRRPPTFLDRTGLFSCSRCKASNTVRDRTRKTDGFSSVITGKDYHIITDYHIYIILYIIILSYNILLCDTKYVTYLLMCPCSFRYVGRTTRKLPKRIGEHITNKKMDTRTTVCLTILGCLTIRIPPYCGFGA